VDEFQVSRGEVGAPLGREVLDLTSDEAATARCVRHVGRQCDGQRRFGGVGGHHQAQRVREQRIAREKGGGLIESPVQRRPPAPQVIVIHAREVIMDQRIGVQALHRDGSRDRIAAPCRIEQLGRRQHDHGADPLAARLDAVTHGRMDPSRTRVRRRQPGAETGFDPAEVGVEFG
jgi:hypothetical protein